MAITSKLFYFFIAITLCTLACGLYVLAEKVWGSRDRLNIKKFWDPSRNEGRERGLGRNREANVDQQEGPSVTQAGARAGSQ